MQVVMPIDIEDALRVDLSAQLSTGRVMAQPVPPDLQPGDVVVYSTGGGRMSAVSNEYDVSIDCYAVDDADACELARRVAASFASLPLLQDSTRWQYNNASANIPYPNFDQRAPQLARYTFTGRVICPGERLSF